MITWLRRWRTNLSLLGTARVRLAVAVAALAATAFTLITSLPAHAEPSPTPSAPAPPAAPAVPAAPGARTPTAEEMAEIEELLREQAEKLPAAAQKAMLEKETERLRELLPDEGGVLSVFNVTDANGIPISVYSVESDTGDFLDWDLGVMNLLTEMCFSLTKWLIAFCCWFIAWALSFGLAKLLMAPVISVANSLHTRVIMEMGLPSVFLAVCAVICVARIFFGNRATGWGDAALSLLLAALTSTLLASPPQALLNEQDGALAHVRGFALEVADVILDADPTKVPEEGDASPAGSGDLSRPLTDALTDAFIVKPAMLLQYGRVFEGECAAAYSDMRLAQLAVNRQVTARTNKLKEYWEDIPLVSGTLDMQADRATDWAIDHYGELPMDGFEKRCVPGDIDAVKQASLDKLGGALFLLVAAGIVSVLVTGLAGGFLVAQGRIAWDAIRAEPALIAGTVPGAGRAFLWDWAASVLRRLGELLVSVIALATFIIIIKAVLDPVQDEWGSELTLRFLIVDVVCIAAVKKRKKLAARSKQVAANWRSKMSAGRIGGTHGSALTPSSAPVAAKRHLARNTARALVRSSLVGVSLAQGNPLAAVAYAMPKTVGATVLASRLNASRRAAAHRAGSSGMRDRTSRVAARRSGSPVNPSRPTSPSTPSRPSTPSPSHPRRPTGLPRPRNAAGRSRTQPATPNPASSREATGRASRRNIQAQRAIARRTHRTATQPPRSTSGPAGFDAWLDQQEERELARRRRTPRSGS